MKLEAYFKGLADVTRLRVLNLLLHGELCGCDIRYVLEMSQPNVSRHLTYLKNCGLVSDRRDGPRIFYRLAEAGFGTTKQLFEFLQRIFKRSGNSSRGHAQAERIDPDRFVYASRVAAFLGTSRYKKRNASVMQEVPKPGADDIMNADPMIPSGSLSTGCDRVHMPT
jgi:ArsR family transcriptional regulator